MTIETLKHEPIVYEVHDYICGRQGTTVPVRQLCIAFYGKFSKSLDTAMRNIVSEIVNDRMMQKVIISTKDGYLHPTKVQLDLIERSCEELKKTAKALLYRRGSIMYKIGKDGQMKEKIGKNDSPVFEAFMDEIIPELENEYVELISKKKHKKAEIVFVETSSGQMALGV